MPKDEENCQGYVVADNEAGGCGLHEAMRTFYIGGKTKTVFVPVIMPSHVMCAMLDGENIIRKEEMDYVPLAWAKETFPGSYGTIDGERLLRVANEFEIEEAHNG